MTHSLHRIKLLKEDRDDFVFLCTPAIGVNHENSRKTLLEILDIILDLEPENINFYEAKKDMDIEKIKQLIHDKSRLRCCFSDRNKVVKLLDILKREDFGLSVVISGCPDEVEQMMQEAGIQPHTINMACGCHGKIENLPDRESLSLISMCGHGLIGPVLVSHMIEKVKTGDIKAKDAAQLIGLPCSCGVYNTVRAEQIITRMVSING